jgi:hypothetical protein
MVWTTEFAMAVCAWMVEATNRDTWVWMAAAESCVGTAGPPVGLQAEMEMSNTEEITPGNIFRIMEPSLALWTTLTSYSFFWQFQAPQGNFSTFQPLKGGFYVSPNGFNTKLDANLHCPHGCCYSFFPWSASYETHARNAHVLHGCSR